MTTKHLLLIFLAGSIAISAKADAQNPTKGVQVYAATRYFDESPNKVFSINDPVKIKLKQGAPKLRADVLQVRVFRGTPDYLAQNPWETDGDCYIYYTNVYQVNIEPSGNQLTVELALNEYWLAELNRRLEKQEWLLVLETISPHGSTIKLKKGELSRYFDNGYVFVAVPGNTVSAAVAESVSNWFRRSYSELSTQRSMTRTTDDCVQYRYASSDLTEMFATGLC